MIVAVITIHFFLAIRFIIPKLKREHPKRGTKIRMSAPVIDNSINELVRGNNNKIKIPIIINQISFPIFLLHNFHFSPS